MVETARATVTMPDVTPKGTSKRTPRSAVDGLRSLAGPRRRSGGGGGGSRPGRPTKPGGGGGIDLRNTWQILLGSVLVPLGVVFILVAWYGSAHTAYIQQQIPYLVSGSFIGLGCLVLGGLLYWAHWLYRIYDQADLHHEEQMRVLEELVRVLGGNDGSRVPQAVDVEPGAEAAATPSRSSGPFYSTASGTVYHQADCPIIAHHPNDLHVLGASALAALRPCQICCPD